jgi:hypothetical protein
LSRIDFLSADAAQFNALRDRWRDVASGTKLPKVAHKLASLLPAFVNREYGYAFPTDEQLAGTMRTSTRNVGKGMGALDAASLIDRVTFTKRDEKGEAMGRMRRIYLTFPAGSERNTLPEVNGTDVNGTPEVNGTNGVSERNNVFRITPDRTTPDKEKDRREDKLGAYARTHARETVPSVFGSDIAFLDTFDQMVLEITAGREIGAGEIERITQEAFDQTTYSDDLFMPILWPDVCAIRNSDTADWFRQRTGILIHRRAA